MKVKKIKAVNIITDINIGGAGRMIEHFAAGFDRDRFDICVILPSKSRLADIIKKYDVTVIAFDKLKGKSLDIASIPHMRKLLKKIKPDIVHTHASFSSRIAARLAGVKKIVYTRHCVYPPGRFMKSFVGKAIGRIMFALFTDLAVAVSPAAAKNLIATGVPKKRIKTVMNGVPPLEKADEKTLRELKNRYGISQQQKIAGMTGRLEEIKGHKYAIKAVAECVAEGMDIKLIVAGTGTVGDELKKAAEEAGVSERIVFTGFVDDVSPLVGMMDIFINASYGTEASSLAILEAMSLGKPVIATEYGGNPYIVKDGETGIIVPVKDSKAMADAIMELLNDGTKCREYSYSAKKEYEEKFTDSVMIHEIEKTYTELAGGKRHPSL